MGCSHLNDLNMSSSSSSSPTATIRPPPLIRNPNNSVPQNTSLLKLCQHQANGSSEQSRTEIIGSSRWNPRPEQLLALEEMYRQGTRTPSADQIQQIATQLRRFGKIEGKNVFYWFQNHKARERQKRRREKEMMKPEEKQHTDPGNSSPEYKKESGLRKTGYEVEQTKDWVPSSNCSKHTEESISMHRGVLVAAESATGPHGWLPFDEKELHQRKRSSISTADHMNATWLTSSSPFSSHLLDTTTESSLETEFLLEPYFENFNDVVDYDDNRETQTLELFPLCRDHEDGTNVKATAKKDAETLHIKPITNQFIEFLPLNN